MNYQRAIDLCDEITNMGLNAHIEPTDFGVAVDLGNGYWRTFSTRKLWERYCRNAAERINRLVGRIA